MVTKAPIPAIDLEEIPIPVLLADASGEVAQVNGAWRQLTGMHTWDSLDGGWLWALDPPQRLEARTMLRTVATGGGRQHVAWRLRGHGDHEWVVATVAGRPGGGAILTVVGVPEGLATRDLERWPRSDQ